jgi:hypothetical protein
MKPLEPLIWIGTAALAGALHLPPPLCPPDMACHIEEPAAAHTHQEAPYLSPIDFSRPAIYATATSHAT